MADADAGDADAAKISELNKKRGFVIKELISTEQTYVDVLQLVVDVYMNPLRDGQILDQHDLNEQFLHWESILGLHKQLLRQLCATDALEVKVGEIFKLYGSFFKMYMQYLSNFEIALTRRAELMCTNKEFEALLERAQADPRCKGLGIESLLVTPVQVRDISFRLLNGIEL